MILSHLFDRRVRGFRVVELAGVSLFLVLALGVYLVKAGAGRERAQIASVERQIVEEQTRMRLLHAEVAHLEDPERIGRLSRVYLGMTPIAPKREASPESLPDIARQASVADLSGAKGTPAAVALTDAVDEVAPPLIPDGVATPMAPVSPIVESRH
jgi:cell division protein FtsL